MSTFLDFINKRNNDNSIEQSFYEGFSTDNMSRVIDLLLNIFNKNLTGKTCAFKNGYNSVSDGKKMFSYLFFHFDNVVCDAIWSINFLKSDKSNEVYSIDIFDESKVNDFMWGDRDKVKSSLSIYTLGSSLAYFIPIICNIVSTKDYDLSTAEAKRLSSTIFTNVKESLYYIGALPYNIYEGMSDDFIENTFRIKTGQIQEATTDDRLRKLRWKLKNEMDSAKGKDPELYNKLKDDYQEVWNAIRGGKMLEDIKLSIRKNIDFTLEKSSDERDAEKKLKENRDDPETAFKKMNIYVKSVITGMQPGVILCGAPGIGKTYRIKKQLKAAGYNEGHNLYTIKGTESPRQLYIDLYEYKEKGKIIVIDDADALVGPKAPEVAINILKAALDSTSDDEGRLVTYKVTGDLKDEEGVPIPKRHYFNGSVIIITNYSIGQLNTALRGRVFTQSLDFDTTQVLNIIKSLIPAIDPVHLSVDAKQKAYEYLVELNEKGTDMELSIRTFSSAARLFQLCEGEDLSEKDVKSMIEEQMRNQAIRGGKSY